MRLLAYGQNWQGYQKEVVTKSQGGDEQNLEFLNPGIFDPISRLPLSRSTPKYRKRVERGRNKKSGTQCRFLTVLEVKL